MSAAAEFSSLWAFRRDREMPRVVFVGGKGGVGKTSTAAALGSGMAREGRLSLLISTDPAHSLFDVLGISPGRRGNRRPRVVESNLHALELDPHRLAEGYLSRVRANTARFLAPKLLGRMEQQIQLAALAPGTLEASLTEEIGALVTRPEYGEYRHLIFDTAPTGHTLRLLHTPEVFAGWVEGLLSARKRAESLARAADALGDRKEKRKGKRKQKEGTAIGVPDDDNPRAMERREKVAGILKERRRLLGQLKRVLVDQSSFFLVLNAEALALQESLRAYATLRELKIPVGALVVNRILPLYRNTSGDLGDFFNRRKQEERRYLQEIDRRFPRRLPRVYQGWFHAQLQGTEALQRLFRGEYAGEERG